MRNSIGISKTTTLDACYAYRLPLGYGKLGFGLQASARHIRQDWTDTRLQGSQPISTDAAIPGEPTNKVVPNFGFGLYYQTKQYFVGFSVPRLLTNNIDFSQNGGILSREARHFYLMGGGTIVLNESVEMTPQALIKYVGAAPLDADLNVNFQLQKRFLAGLTYRTGSGKTSAGGESLDVLAGVQLNSALYFGLSYDIGLTQLRKYNNGSVEATLRYWLNPPSGAVIADPREF